MSIVLIANMQHCLECNGAMVLDNLLNQEMAAGFLTPLRVN